MGPKTGHGKESKCSVFQKLGLHRMKKKQTNKLIYILPVLALVGYFAGQTIKKQFLSSEEAKIEEEVFPIVRENISDDMKLVIEPDHIEIVEGTIVVYLKQ